MEYIYETLLSDECYNFGNSIGFYTVLFCSVLILMSDIVRYRATVR
jgi:hypothetical protein